MKSLLVPFSGLIVVVGLACALPVHAAVPAAPTQVTVVGGSYTNDTTPTITWTAVSGATHYDYRLNANTYIGVGTGTSITLGTLRDGWYTVGVRAQDGTGNSSREGTVTFEIDTAGPSIPALSPATATVGETVTFRTTPTSDAWVASCSMRVDAENAMTMREHNGTFSAATRFTTSGTHTATVTCTDGDHNSGSGTTAITVAASSSAREGDLIKTATMSAVYYYGEDGMRHVFPDETVYYSWYDDFTTVRTVSDAFLASLPLGDNVTMRPGSVLVRFASDDDVFAVDAPNRLRRYVSAALALLDYGAGWASLLVTIPDVWRGNYDTGSDIDAASDYDPEAAFDALSAVGDLF